MLVMSSTSAVASNNEIELTCANSAIFVMEESPIPRKGKLITLLKLTVSLGLQIKRR